MSTDGQWMSRWNVDQRYHDHSAEKGDFPPPPITSSALQTTRPSARSYHQSSEKLSSRIDEQHQTRQLPSVAALHTDASNCLSGSAQRHTPLGGNFTATSPPNSQRFASPWHSLPFDHRAHQKQVTPDPLTLQIPDVQGTNDSGVMTELPRISTDIRSISGTPISRQHNTTSLPSFASFREHASRDEPDEVEIAPMSARLSCQLCTSLKPLVRDVALAVAELDEQVQTSCNKSTSKALDIPRDSPVRTVQWVLDRLSNAKLQLQELSRRGQVPQNGQILTPYSGLATQNAVASPNLLKRPAWEHDEQPSAKRRDSGVSVNGTIHGWSGSGLKGERRPSADFTNRSPQPTESAPGSAYPRNESPGFPGRPQRALPSPTSTAYPSVAPSFLPQAGASGGSPTNSYQPTVSIHTASASSATSAHIADLQHQVTLKSLALQTLQSEYSSLLQKLQRERVKSQAIEKKTTVADQEVNDLTTRSEELTEQIKALETQLEASERKREDERAQSGREKEQWQRMLELGGRVQSRYAEEKQKLRDECDALAQRLASYETNGPGDVDNSKRSLVSHIANSLRPSEHFSASQSATLSNAQSPRPSLALSNDLGSLKQEIEHLNTRIEFLQFALEEAQRHNQFMNVRANELIQRSGQVGDVLQRALEDGRSANSKQSPPRLPLPPPPATEASLVQPSLSALHSANGGAKPSADPTYQESSALYNSADSRKGSQTTASSSATLASMARAVSPGPAELGFHVTPSTSSPEELIAALGPVPAPLPRNDMHFHASIYAPMPDVERQPIKAKRAKQQRRQSADVVGSWMLPRIEERVGPGQAFHIGGFRPLNYDGSNSSSNALHTLGPEEQSSPPSYHSSPGPMRHGVSSSSGGSAGNSPKDRPDQLNDEKIPFPSINPTQPGLEHQRSHVPGLTAAMPPPPRPGPPIAAASPISSTSHEGRHAL